MWGSFPPEDAQVPASAGAMNSGPVFGGGTEGTGVYIMSEMGVKASS